jgi:exonuclease SbcC
VIREIEISNYQSLRKVRVRLGRFTAITGRTGTGKSALIRAVELLVSNARGTSYITRGEKTAGVVMKGEDEHPDGAILWDVAIRRGGQDRYDLRKGTAKPVTFTKMAGKVPEPVTNLLRLGDVNFAGQFAMPYLLDSKGSEVSRVLGKLTNVTLLYRAAQEANRRRLASNALLKGRETDLAALQQQVEVYATLPAEKVGVEAAEAAIGRMQALVLARERLERLVFVLMQAQSVAVLVRQPVPDPPSLDTLGQLVARRERLRLLLAARDDAGMQLRFRASEENLSAGEERKIQQEFDRYKEQWGVCPTCGQPVRQEQHEHSEP